MRISTGASEQGRVSTSSGRRGRVRTSSRDGRGMGITPMPGEDVEGSLADGGVANLRGGLVGSSGDPHRVFLGSHSLSSSLLILAIEEGVR